MVLWFPLAEMRREMHGDPSSRTTRLRTTLKRSTERIFQSSAIRYLQNRSVWPWATLPVTCSPPNHHERPIPRTRQLQTLQPTKPWQCQCHHTGALLEHITPDSPKTHPIHTTAAAATSPPSRLARTFPLWSTMWTWDASKSCSLQCTIRHGDSTGQLRLHRVRPCDESIDDYGCVKCVAGFSKIAHFLAVCEAVGIDG